VKLPINFLLIEKLETCPIEFTIPDVEKKSDTPTAFFKVPRALVIPK
jgi:hypothetical protein